MTPVHVAFEITPLTRSGKDQEVYVRREEVTRQLEELSRSTEEVIARRIKVEQEEEPESIKSEALVFLYRLYLGMDLAEDIFKTLTLRVERMLRKVKWTYSMPEQDFEDFLQDVHFQLLDKISAENNKGDFAQASFGDYVKALSQNELKKYVVRSKRKKVTDSIDETYDGEDNSPVRITVEEMNLSPDERLLLTEAINSMEEPNRTVWLMFHQMGFQIESKDPNERTISKHYNRTGRTIRNWLADAEKSLKKWKSGH